nr:RHS repeat-associated core domain-containing protein [uncultured Desulfobacter sp.]
MEKKIYASIAFIMLVLPCFVYAQALYGPAIFSADTKNILSNNYHHLSLNKIRLRSTYSTGRIIFRKQTGSEFKWGFAIFNFQVIPLKQFLTDVGETLEISAKLKKTNRLTLYFVGKKNAAISLELDDGTSASQPEILSFTADPETIETGQSTELSWEVENAETISIDNGIGTVDASGSMTVSPTQALTYTLTAHGDGQEVSASVSVTVNIPAPTVSISVSPESITNGNAAILSWSSSHTSSCTISPDIGDVALNGSTEVSPKTSTTYMISAQGLNGDTITASADLSVSGSPELSVSNELIPIPKGESAQLAWTVEDAELVHIDQGVGKVSGTTALVTPDNTTIYTITATNSYGTTSKTVTVKVLSTPQSLAEGSFGKEYEDLIPEDATLDEYESQRFAILTGLVTDGYGSPLSGVTVMVFEYPEYGSAVTDDEGRFAIPAEGGQDMIIAYTKQGRIPVHRQAYVPWNDFAVFDTIQMIETDTAATTISFDGNSGTVFTHRSTPVTDEFGTRTVTLVTTGDNKAFITDENGDDVTELERIEVRTTEYPTPESMPAVLPPTSAFTFCAELAVDGVQRVRFANPFTVFVDNFLGFDVGLIVPVGYYDMDLGYWIPKENAKVVKLLDTDGDGVVDALDADGDDLADDLNGDGSVTDEVTGLGDPDYYEPGNTMWRFQAEHFSPWDCNDPVSFPPGAIPPNPTAPPFLDNQKSEGNDCKNIINSYVEERSRLFHETIPIPGTDLSLHYSTANLTSKTDVNIPLSRETVPDNLIGIELIVSIAGKTYKYAFDPLPNLNYLFTWDGLDWRGVQVAVPSTLSVTINFLYQGYYGSSYNDFIDWFGKYPDGLSFRIKSRLNVKKTLNYNLTMAPRNGRHKGQIANGWTLSRYHFLNPVDPTVLIKGDGGKSTLLDTDYKYSRIDQCNMMEKVGGTENSGFSGDNGPATEADFEWPQGIAVDGAGNLYIADTANMRIRKIDTQGIVTTIAGNGNFQDGTTPVDGLPATDIPLKYPTDITSDNNGNVFFVDAEPETGGRVLKIDKNGIISTVVGGDAKVYGIASDGYGNLFIAEPYKKRIRMVDPTGKITLVAGSGYSGYSGDGGNAMQARFVWPVGVAVDNSGNLYIADKSAHVIRRVDVSGVITTVAGTGKYGYSGDGEQATTAQLTSPGKIALDVQGNLYILNAMRIRKINTSGVIKTITGDGGTTQSVEGTSAIEPDLINGFSNLAIDDSGNIYTALGGRNIITKLGPLVPYFNVESEKNRVYAESNGYGHILDSSGCHIKTIDLETGATLYTFKYQTSSFALEAVIDAFSNETTILRGSSTAEAIISPEGLRTELDISNGNLNRITFPDGSFYDFEYDDNGYMETETDPVGNQFFHTFSDSGKITDIKDENGGHWNYEQEDKADCSVLTRVTTGEGNQREYTDFTDATGAFTSTITNKTGGQTFYSSSGLTGEKTNACGLQTNFEYGIDPRFKYKYLAQVTETTPSGLTRNQNVKRVYTDPETTGTNIVQETREVNGNTTTIENNTLENCRTITSPEGRTVQTLYSPDTLLTEQVSIPELLASTFEYDTKGRLTTSATGDRTFRYTYDGNGFVDTVTDPNGNTRTFTHDENGRTTRIHRPDSTDIYFSYDANDHVTVLTTPSSVNHAFNYNKVNLTSGYTPPLSSNYTFEFDRDRRPTRTVFPSGKTLENIYESDLDRLASIQTPEGLITFTYLCGAKIGSMSMNEESLTYEYDAGLVTSQTLGGTLNQTLSWSYNDDFRVSGMTYAGKSVDYGYDNDGLLTLSGDFAITRNSGNGLPESVTNGRLNVTGTFNGYGEVSSQDTTVNGSSLLSYTLERDNTGRITRKTETLAGTTAVLNYTYDTMGRLLTVTKDGRLVEDYQYNANGARISETNTLRDITNRTFEYTAEDHLVSAGTVTYTHDADGFLTSKTDEEDVTAYTYAIRGELLNVTLPNGDDIEYVHDPLGRRIAKKINGTTTEKYLWQGLTRLLAVYDGSGGLVTRFTYADGRLPVAMTMNGATYYPAFDQTGTLKAVADASGNVVKQVEYDTFGNVINDTAPEFTVPFGFAGGLYDPDTGLVRFGFRDYDPDTGRWTAKDPIFFAGGDTDLYGYVLNDPVNFIDPWGLKKWHAPDGTHTVGRSGTPVPTGGGIGTFIENNVASGYTFGETHDSWVEYLTDQGYLDTLVNIPTMPAAYVWSIFKDNAELPSDQRPKLFPIIEIKFDLCK